MLANSTLNSFERRGSAGDKYDFKISLVPAITAPYFPLHLHMHTQVYTSHVQEQHLRPLSYLARLYMMGMKAQHSRVFGTKTCEGETQEIRGRTSH